VCSRRIGSGESDRMEKQSSPRWRWLGNAHVPGARPARAPLVRLRCSIIRERKITRPRRLAPGLGGLPGIHADGRARLGAAPLPGRRSVSRRRCGGFRMLAEAGAWRQAGRCSPVRAWLPGRLGGRRVRRPLPWVEGRGQVAPRRSWWRRRQDVVLPYEWMNVAFRSSGSSGSRTPSPARQHDGLSAGVRSSRPSCCSSTPGAREYFISLLLLAFIGAGGFLFFNRARQRLPWDCAAISSASRWRR